MGRVRVTLVTGLTLLAATVGLTLTQAPMSLARRSTSQEQPLASISQAEVICQSHEVLPRATTAIRLHLFAEYGPKVTLQLSERGRVIASGQQRGGWTGGAVTVPVSPLARRRAAVKLCFTLSLNGDETVSPAGEPTEASPAARVGGTTLLGRVAVEDLRPGPASWWSLLPQVARRAGLGRAAGGTWSVVLVAALMGAVLALCSGLIVRELR